MSKWNDTRGRFRGEPNPDQANIPPLDLDALPWVAHQLYAMLPGWPLLRGALYHPSRGLDRIDPPYITRFRFIKLTYRNRLLAQEFDIDRAGFKWLSTSLYPRPSWIVYNLASGHCHVAYLFPVPLKVLRRRISRLASGLHALLGRALDADMRHTSPIVPNPLYGGPETRTVWTTTTSLMRATDMYGWMRQTAGMLDVAPATGPALTGAGRNVDVFTTLREEEWRTVGRFHRQGDREGWSRHMLVQALSLNAALDTPMDDAEVMGIARNVGRFLWRWFDPAKEQGALRMRQRRRGVASGRKRQSALAERDGKVRELIANGLTQREVAAALGISQMAVSRTLARHHQSKVG